MLTVAEEHPLYEALSNIVEIFDRKNGDYALDSDKWSNFRSLGEHFDLPPYEVALFYSLMKFDRIKSLRKNGRAPANESVVDSYLDLANYALISYAIYLEESS